MMRFLWLCGLPWWAMAYRPTTVLYAKIPVKRNLTPAQRILQQQDAQDEVPSSTLDDWKRSVYNFSDSVGSLTKAKPKEDPRVLGGYKEQQEKTPTAQFLENMQRARSLVRPEEDELPAQEMPPSRFDAFKASVYGTADDIQERLQNSRNSPRRLVPPPAKTRLASTTKDLPDDLDSPNPIKRLQAEWKVKDLELKENVRGTQSQIVGTFRSTKEFVYAVMDTVRSVYQFLLQIPGRIQRAIERITLWLSKIPAAVESTVDTVVSIPAQVEATTTQVKTSVETTVEKTQQTVERIQSIPSKVQQTVQDTKQTVESTSKSVEELVFNAKVLAGLEERKPIPPKPKTGAEIAKDVAGAVATGFGKSVWWVGTKSVGLAFSAAGAGVKKAFESAAKGSQPKDKATAPVEKKPDPSVLDTNALDKEVEHALATAAKALEEQKNVGTKGKDDTDSN